MPASVRTLSQLPSITSNELCNRSKLEVSVPVQVEQIGGERVYRYASKSITAGNLSEKISNDVRTGLIEANGLTENIRVDDLCTTVSSIISDDFSFFGTKNFDKDPRIDNSPLSSYSLSDDTLNKYSVNYETLKKFSYINSAPAIGPNFGFVTRLSGFQGDSSETERLLTIFKPEKISGEWTFSPEPYFVFNTNVKNVVPNEYIFRIERGKKESQSWKSPASGIFTCYGWLDEINNPSQSNESRWVALMGRQSQLANAGWSILQVQPFIKNNYLSYVGFTFPVKKGMELKIVTGFAVGGNSDKYFASNSSIANHIGNAFLGGVYTGLSAYNEYGGEYSARDVSTDYITSADLSNIIKHERECDLSVKDAIDFLSDEIDKLEPTQVNNYYTHSFIDTEKLSSYSVANGGMNARELYFGNSNDYNGSKLTDVVSYSQYYFGDEKTQSSIVYNGHFYKYLGSSVTWNDNPPGLTSINNRWYQRIDIPTGGENVFYTDDYFWYYTTNADALVYIVGNPDFADSPPTALQCYLRYLNSNGEPCFKNIGSAVEYSSGGSDSRMNVSIPLKRGSTIAFGAFVRWQEEEVKTMYDRKKMTWDDGTNQSILRINAKIYKDDPVEWKKNDDGEVTWKNQRVKTLTFVKPSWSNNGEKEYLVTLENTVVNDITITLQRYVNGSNNVVWVRLVDDAGNVIGSEKSLPKGTGKVQVSWHDLKFGTSKTMSVEVAYGGATPTKTTKTYVWISELKISSKYIKSKIDPTIIGAPCPMFTNVRVQDLIDKWKHSAGAIGELIQPHNRPKWLIVSGTKIMASVSLIGLGK